MARLSVEATVSSEEIRAEVSYEYRIESERASSRSAAALARRTHPALDAGFFVDGPAGRGTSGSLTIEGRAISHKKLE
jgi:hypothetical protein